MRRMESHLAAVRASPPAINADRWLHHRRVVEKPDWNCHLDDEVNPSGVPLWIAPPWIDPSQRLIRNTAHD
jgi:hypothetical protein